MPRGTGSCPQLQQPLGVSKRPCQRRVSALSLVQWGRCSSFPSLSAEGENEPQTEKWLTSSQCLQMHPLAWFMALSQISQTRGFGGEHKVYFTRLCASCLLSLAHIVLLLFPIG